MTTGPSIARSSLAMAGGSVASRILGVARQSLIVLAIGQGVIGNAFTTANTLPNIIYMVIAGGVLNSILVPQIIRAAKNPDGGRDFTDRILTIATILFLVVTVVCTMGAGLLIRLYASDKVAPEALSLATFFAFITIPQIFFYGMYAVLGQILNARGRFAAFGWSPALANVVQIIGLIAFILLFHGPFTPGQWTSQMVWLFAGTATLSIAVQAVFLVIPLWRSGFRWTPRFGLRGVGLGQTSRVAGWAFAALIVSQLAFLLASKVMWHASGQSTDLHFIPGVTVYTNALFVFQVPHALVALSIITALYPRISKAAHERDNKLLRREYVRGLTVPTALTLPASVALLFFALPVTTFLYSSRDPAELGPTAQVLAAMAIGVVPFGIDVLNQRFFYAHDDGRMAFWEQVVLSVSASVITLVALVLRPEHTVAIIGLGIVVSNVLSSLFGLYFIRKRIGHLGLLRILRVYGRIGAASLVAGLLGWLVVLGFDGLVHGRLGALVTLAVGGAVFALAYVLMASLLQIREFWEIVDPLLRRLPSGRGGGYHSKHGTDD